MVLVARVVDLATTRILSAGSVTVPKDAGIRNLMAKLLGASGPPPPGSGSQQPPGGFSNIPAGDPQLYVRVWTDRNAYRIGETIRFHFATSRNAYITLMNYGTSGRSTVLFPNAYSQGNLVQGGATYSLPGSNDGFEFRIQSPAGFELIRIIATDTPWSPSFQLAPQGGAIFRSLDPVEGKTLTRDLGVMQKQRPPTQRAEEIVRVEVLP